MRILVHEFVSGGGLAGRPLPAPLAREGRAMLEALLADLAALPGLGLATTTDPRVRLRAPAGVDVVPLASDAPAALERLIRAADAVWLIAPETHGRLADLAAAVEAAGRRLLGPDAAALRHAADKAAVAARLADAGVAHPPTTVLPPGDDARAAAREIGYPVVVKPARGAGCEGVGLAAGPAELRRAAAAARDVAGGGPILIQAFVPGTAASVALVGDGRRAVPLALNRQHVRPGPTFEYAGGQTPLDHRQGARALEQALRAYGAVPGLRGYIGVDVVLTDSEAFVVEINPRLTTAYLGVRAALAENPAALALAACAGALPAAPPVARRRVRFTAAGAVHPAATSSPTHTPARTS